MRLLVAFVAILALPAVVTAQQTHLLVITGLGGDLEYTERFHDWATTLIDAAVTRYELPRDNVTYLGEKPDLDPEAIAGRSSRDNIEAAVETIAGRAGPSDHVVIVLFGHGGVTDAPRVNLPGRDPSAEDFAVWLDRLGDRQVTFVNAASSSGPFVEALSGEGRVVMTATRNAGEKMAPTFGGYFVEAFADGSDDADQNKDQRVSMLEAFSFAQLKVAQSYEADGRLATEHPLLDDDGDGEGTQEPDPLEGDGRVARASFFTSGEASTAEMAFPDDPELQALYAERQTLQDRVEELQRLKGGTDEDRYAEELETLLVQLALKSREIRQLEEAKGAGSR